MRRRVIGRRGRTHYRQDGAATGATNRRDRHHQISQPLRPAQFGAGNRIGTLSTQSFGCQKTDPIFLQKASRQNAFLKPETSKMEPQSAQQPNRRRRLISRTSILILGGFLCGISWNASMHGELTGIDACVFLMALFAMLAFLGLDMTAWARRQRAVKRAEMRTAQMLEQRMSRHLSEYES